MRVTLCSLLFLCTLLPGNAAPAEPAVPSDLQPWVPWVLHPLDQRACPVDMAPQDGGDQAPGSTRVCAWPGRLGLDLNPLGGTFNQRWQVYAESWVQLPGDTEHWPLEVRDGDQSQAVILHQGAPAVKLTPGIHALSGRFQWQGLPEGLSIPAATGLISLVQEGKPVPFPRLDRGGRLWLGDPAANADEDGDQLALQVYRRIDDDLPLQVTTRLELDVAGRARQVQIGPVLLPEAIPLRVQSPLPARLDPDGTLRIQVRPGHWVLEVGAHHDGAVGTLTRGDPPAPWPAIEVWSFAARPDLRQVELSGPTAVDPRQAGVPPAWSDLPAYRLAAGEVMALAERRRGNPDPGPDQLNLERELWLDLGGGAFSVRDRINGQLTRSWRLAAAPPLALGRVQVDGEPRLITRLPEADQPGVEVRRGRLDLVAEGRIAGVAGPHPQTIPATGWGLDFSSARTRLYLPPGWDLFAASGTDNLPDSWIGRWTLLDLFLVLILAFGVGRLWGLGWGLLAGLALALTWQVPTAPRLVWVNLLTATALLRLLPERPATVAMTRIHALITWYRRLALLGLVLIGLPFVVGQVRTGLYPHLERPAVGLGTNAGEAVGLARVAPVPTLPQAHDEARIELEPAPAAQIANDTPANDMSANMSDGGRADSAVMARKSAGKTVPRPVPAGPPADQPDPDAVVQSGVGLPDWQWHRFDLTWRGSVAPTQRARLWLLNPLWHLLWSLLGALLTVILGLRVADLIGHPATPPADSEQGSEPNSEPGSAPVPGTALRTGLCLVPALALATGLGAACLVGPGTTLAAELPDTKLLDELRTRLLAPPDCLPNCADLAILTLTAEPDSLRLTLTLDAATPVATAVPGGAGGWLPTTIELDGTPLDGLRRDRNDRLVVPLPAGRHRLELAGPLPERTQVEIPFPLRPRQLAANLNGWTLEGLDAGGRPGPQIRLVRVATREGTAKAPLSQGALPPLLRVERGLRLGLDWRVETRVQRLSPAEFPVSLSVPLLPGESVQTPGFRSQDGMVLVNLAPGETETVWSSTLEPASTLRLTAVADPQLSESWSLDLSPRWHLEWSGPAPLQRRAANDRWQPTWRPLPGETLSLTFDRPSAVPGQTLTVERVDLRVTLGRRGSESELRLALRGSQGGIHPIRLPPGAEPTRFQVNRQDLPLPKAGASLEIPLTPGQASVLIQWRAAQETGLRIIPGLPELDSPAVNLNLAVQVPADRWVLLTGGPRIGPVVLFWGVLLVLAGFAAGLARLRLTPLKAHDWMLLGIGLSLAEVWVLVLVTGWLLALGLRRRLAADLPRRRYNLVQIALVLLTMAAGLGLVGAVSQGLLGAPDMQIMGNGSGHGLLNWYQDRTTGPLPRVWVLAVPMWVYRALMLAWALWLALRLLDWLRWGWDGFSHPVLWRPGAPQHPPAPPQGDSSPPGSEESVVRD